MDTYTESLENRARDISPEEDIDYSRALVEVVSMFRNFDEALDTFIISHGYSGDRHDVDEKTSFIKAKFQQKLVHSA